MNNLKELKQRALAGDRKALEELRRLGLLSADRSKYSVAPASYAQSRLWFIDRMEPSPAYNLPAGLIFEGKLDVEALEKAFREIIDRHEILRTCFVETDGVPYQKIYEKQEFNLPVTDLTAAADQDGQISALLKEKVNRWFDLSKGPLLVCRLMKLNPEKFLLLFNMHHIISDGWSVGVLIAELTQLYNAFGKGLESPLPPLNFQYKDYARRNEQMLKNGQMDEHRNYWLNKLSGELQRSDLPPDKNRPAGKTFNGCLFEVELEQSLHEKIRELIRQERVSLFMFLIAAVDLLLYRYTGKTDILLGSPVSGREQRDLDDQIGFYVNALALRNQIDPSEPFSGFLARVRKECIEAYDHQAYPFDLLVGDLNLERDTSRNPLFETMVSLQDLNADSFPFDEIKTSVLKPEIAFSKVDLHFGFEESGEGMKLGLVYNPDLYTSAKIVRLAGHFIQLLKNIVAGPGSQTGRIECITSDEKEQILHFFNDTTRDFPKDKTIAGLFDEMAEKFPDKPAVVYQGRALTYRQLKAKTGALAGMLVHDDQLQPEEPVMILIDRSHELVIAILAVLKAGGAYVPLDINTPEERIRLIQEDTGARILLTGKGQGGIPVETAVAVDTDQQTAFSKSKDAGPAEAVAALEANRETHPGDGSALFPEADIIRIKVDQEKLSETQSPESGSGKTPSSLAYILYTSGSTGKPKGSMIEEHSVIRLVRNNGYTTFTEKDRYFSVSSVAFDATTLDLWGTLLNGGTYYLEDQKDYLDPQKLKQFFDKYEINRGLFPTGLFNLMTEADEQYDLQLFRGLNEIMVGGDRMNAAVAGRFIERYPDCRLLNGYGPTENTTVTTVFAVTEKPDGEIPIGKPVNNSTVYIFDDWQNLCPVGIAGELYIGGEGLSRGYVNRPDLDRKCFVENPYVKGERLYRSGDMAMWTEDGNILFLGRMDDQVKIRGFRVETGEIENTAVRFPGVNSAKVVIIPEKDQKQLALYYTATGEVREEELKDFLGRSLPDYMIPLYWMQLEQFPLNQNGKPDLKALPKPKAPASAKNLSAPSGPTQQTLARIFEEILNSKRVSVSDNFFSLGGHSLKAIKAVSAIRKELSVSISLKEFFASPDILSLEKLIRNKKREALGPVPLVPEAEQYELSNAQKRLWVLDKIEKSKSTYNIPMAVRILDEVNAGALQKALDKLIARHEALRTVFMEQNGSPFQQIVEEAKVPFMQIDFSEEADPEASAREYLVAEAHRPFTLSALPLMRLALIKMAAGQSVLFLNIHHIVCDGWSLTIMISELFREYARLTGMQQPEPERLPIQYKDYAAWMNRRIADQAHQEDRDYWLKKLGGEITPLDLPSDFRRPAVKTYEGDSLHFTFGTEFKKELDAFCLQKRSSLFMVLTAALKVLLYRYTAKDDLIVGTPVAGRDHPDLENQVGYYVNTLALRDRIHPEKSLAAFLEDIRETTTDAYSHQMYPFDKLVDELKLARDTSRSPLFDVMIVMQHTENIFPEVFSRLEPCPVPMNISKFDLTFNFNDTGNDLELLLEYNTRLYRKERAEQMAGHIQILLREFMDNPAQSIRTVRFLSSREKEDLLVRFNDTQASYPAEKTVTALFAEAAARYPSRTAVVYREKTLTYAEADRLARKVASLVSRHHRLAPGEPVGVLISPSEMTVPVLLGILKAGGAYVPMDPEYPDERIRHILSESRTKLLLTRTAGKARLEQLCKEAALDCTIVDADLLPEENVSEMQLNGTPADPDTTAYIIFTSGSTGKPKGCPISHRNLVRLFINDRSHFDFGPDDVWIMAHSYCFDFSVWEMYGALLFGGKLIIPDRNQVRDISAFVRLVSENGVTVLNQTPGAFYKFVDTVLAGTRKIPLSLRYIIFGGDKLDPSKLQKWIRSYPAREVRLINMYGITETTIHVTYHRLTGEEIIGCDGSSNIGIPLPETRVYILDQDQQLVPAGVYGEIYVSGTGLSKGYLNRPDLTAERFIDNPFESNGKMYRSGDIGRWLYDGTMEYLDRCDNQVQIRGFRVETAEVELQLRRFPGITDTVVVPVDREGTRELAAYVVSRSELKITELKNFLSESLPDYMIPACFVKLDKIPLTNNGKLDKKALPPAIQNIATGALFESPETKIEAELTELWQEVLQTTPISIHDNFFDLGGNSILLVKLHSRINALYPGMMEITDLFTKSRIAEQAAFISEKTGTARAELKPMAARQTEKLHDIAIVGMALRVGSCRTPGDLWNELRVGADLIGPMPEQRKADIQKLARLHGFDPEQLKFREYCYLPEIDKFDHSFFRLSPAEAALIDPAQRLFLETAWHALEDAGYGGDRLWGSRTGVYIGSSDNLLEYTKYVEASENPDPNMLLTAQTPSILASRLAYQLNLKGPAMLVDTACSSSLVALHLACQSIREGKIDSAIVGGSRLRLLPFDAGLRMEIDSSDGRAHSFDDSANGTGGGEGVIVLFIRPLEKAIHDRDHIHAVIRGTAVNQDGNSNGITAPDPDAQADVIDQAWQDAGIDPHSVSFIETHGTATKLGDPIEIDGITKAFSRYTSDKGFCAIGAVKANIGHLDTVAGLAGIVKAVLSLQHRELTPLAHFQTPNRNINFKESAAFINRDLTDWTTEETPLRCGVSSFGLSGTNCHVVLEEAPVLPPVNSLNGKQPQLLVLSAKSREALLDYAGKLKSWLDRHPQTDPADLCYTLATGRGHYNHRLAVAFQSVSELSALLEKLAAADPETEKSCYGTFRVVAANKEEIQPGEITEIGIRRISQEINSRLREQTGTLQQQLAEAYLKGTDIEWNDYYGQTAHNRISLPGYPFERKRCWVKLKTDALSSYDRENAVLLQRCIANTPSVAVYSSVWNGNTWLLNEHRIMGRPTLVGVAYLQMASEAAKNCLKAAQLHVDELYLLQPLSVEPGKDLEVLTTIQKKGNSALDAEIQSGNDDAGWTDYARFKVSSYQAAEECLDLQAIMNEMDLVHGSGNTDAPREEEIVQVSDKWGCLKRIWRNKEASLAELQVPEKDEELASRYILYPPLVDAALSYALDEPGFLPWSFASVELREKLPCRIFSYIRKKAGSGPQTRSYTVQLTDEAGRVLVRIGDFMLRKAAGYDKLFHELVWKAWPLTGTPPKSSSPIVVLYHDNCNPAWIEALKSEKGVSVFEIGQAEEIDVLRNRDSAKVICLLPPVRFDEAADTEELLNRSLYPAFRLARQLAAGSFTRLDLLFAGENVMKVTGDEPELHALNYTVAGLGQVIGRENPAVRCRFLDLDEQTPAGEILKELQTGFDESWYYRAIRKGKRYIREIRDLKLSSKEPSPWKPEPAELYLITGGTGGIGLELAHYLARQAPVKLALMNRTAFPSEDCWDQLLKEGDDPKLCRKIEKIREIRQEGAEVLFCTADISDRAAWRTALDQLHEKAGRICGVIHAAGVPGNGLIFNKDLEQFRAVIRPKIQGTINLCQLLKDDRPGLFLMTSALTAIIPTAGQSDYTAANSFLDALAAELNRKGIPALSINLTAWKETGMAWESGVAGDGIFKSLSTRDGIDAIGKILHRKTESVILGETDPAQLEDTAGLPFYLEKSLLPKTEQQADEPAAAVDGVRLLGRESGQYSETEQLVVWAWGTVLGYHEIGISDNYYDLGGDSIHAIRIAGLLEKQNIKVAVSDLFSYLTVAELAAFIQSKKGKAQEVQASRQLSRISVAENQEHYPLSSAQRRLFVLDRLTTDKRNYHIPEIWQIRGKLRTNDLIHAFEELTRRHEILRTSFGLVQDEPVQFVHDEVAPVIPVLKMTGQQASDHILGFIRPFDLGRVPLFRVEVIMLSPEEHLVLFDAHHIILDAFSMEILKKEVFAFYEGNRPEPLRIRYRDYAVWQNSPEGKQETEKHRDWWLDQFKGEIPVLDLPLDYPRIAGQSAEAGTFSFSLDERLTAEIKKMSASEGFSTFMILLAVYQLLLHRYSGQDDIVTGITTTGRNQEDLDALLGMFVNNLPVRTYPKDDKTVRAFLEEIRHTLSQAFAHQDYPFDELVGNLNIKRDLDRSPLFDTVFSYMNFELQQIRNGELQLSDYRAETVLSSEYDLMLYGLEAEEKIYISVKYKKALFRKESIARFATRFVKTAEFITRSISSRLADLDILLPEELEMLNAFNRQTPVISRKTDAADLLKDSFRRYAGRIALVCNDRQMTYSELDEQSNRLARYLRTACSVKFGDLVGILLNRDGQMVVAMLGIMKSGAAYVGIDPAYPKERIDYILKDSRARILLTSKDLQMEVTAGIRTVSLDDWEWLEQPASEPVMINTPGDTAYVIYTSGSTGLPKGVVISWSNFSVFLQWCRLEFGSTPFEITYAGTSYCFDISVFEIFYTLVAGKTIRILPSPMEIPRWLTKDRKVLINTVPSLMAAIRDELDETKLNHIAAINLAGEAIPQALVDSFDCDRLEVRNLYGPSEDTTYSTVYRFSEKNKQVLIGKPVSNTQIYLTDANMRLVPPGHTGEICISGDGLAKGYLYREELTNEKFVPNPFGTGRLYKTGDLGRWTETGDLDYLGRIDRQVKIRGFRVELGETEACIRRYPAVENAVVVAVDRNGEKDIAAYLVAPSGLDVSDLKADLARHLPAFMIPRYFTLLDCIPLTPNGKVDVKALPEPEQQAHQADDVFSQTEQQLAELWKAALGTRSVSRHDNFFDLGGHSLTALKLIARINRTFGQDFALSDLFENPSVARFAALMPGRASSSAGLQPLRPLPKAADYELSYAQRRMWVFDRMEDKPEVYNIPVVYYLESSFDEEALEQAFRALIRKYESLRTCFTEVDGEPRQVIRDDVEFKLDRTDLACDADFRGKAKELVVKTITVPFDLSKAPLIAVTLIRNQLRPECILIVNVHHIILDEWSIGILSRDLAVFYDRFSGQRNLVDSTAFEPSPVQYKEFAVWHNDQIEHHDEHRQFWLDLYREPAPPLDLPSDYPRPGTRTFEGKTEKFTLPAALAQGLQKLGAEHHATMFTTILTLLNVLFSRYAGLHDLVIGTPVANRDHPDVQDQIGFFLNTLALRNRVDPAESFSSLLHRVRKNTLDAFDHQLYPFDKLVDELKPDRDPSRSPLFDVMLIAQTTTGKGVNLSSGLKMEPMEFDYPLSKFDLSVSFCGEGDAIDFFFEYSTALFKAERIRKMFGHLTELAQSVLEDARKPVSGLNMLPAEEKERLSQFSAGESRSLKYGSIVEMIEQAAAENRDRQAVVFKRKKLNFEEVNVRANQLGRVLIREGIIPGDFVGVMSNRDEWSVISMLAILKAGAVYVPVDPNYPQSRIEYILNDSNCKKLIMQGQSGLLQPEDKRMIDLEDLKERIFAEDNSNLEVMTGSGAYVIYTSGSTGQPKGVLGTHRCLLNLIEWQSELIGEHLKTLQFAPHSFDVSVQEILFSLATGGTLYLIENETRYRMAEIAEIIEKESVELLTMPYSALNLFLGEMEDIRQLRSLKHVITSGEQPYLNRALAKLLKTYPAIRFHNQYGPSETHVVTSFTMSGEEQGLPARIPAGRPIRNTQIWLLDKEMQLVPEGVPGDLYIGGMNVAMGYIGKPELTAERFIPDPFGDGMLYRSGDLARWDDQGLLEFLGRDDGQVKLRGFRIELGEIESSLLKYPGIRETAVKLTGEGENKEIAAYFTAGEEIELSGLKDFLVTLLPNYMIPAYFVRMDAFPRTPSGKTDVRSLPAPGEKDQAFHAEFEAPQGEVEITLAGIWKKILHRKQISVHDHFFEIGGNSIKAIQTMSAIRKQLGKNSDLNLIFRYPTIRQMAAIITATGERLKSLGDDYILWNPGQERMLFFMPPGIGYSFAYMDFARYFEHETICGLNFMETAYPEQSMADRLIELQPEGKFYLFGHSAGGNMAFDVVVELQKRGRQVGGLVLLDSYRQLEVIGWSEEEYLNDAVLYIEQNHAEFLDEQIRDAALQKIIAYRRYLNGRAETQQVEFPIIQIEAGDEITAFGNKISRQAWEELTPRFEVTEGFGGHMDMLKQPNLEKNAKLTVNLFGKLS